MFDADRQYAVEQVKKLEGYKIVGACEDPENNSYGFVLAKGKAKKLCWIDCDPEGNGPGWISVEDPE